jgi:hypothetical protein
MSDTIDTFRDMKDHKKRLRAAYGINCPLCVSNRPKAAATILLPQQRCRVDGYIDVRPELTDAQYEAV